MVHGAGFWCDFGDDGGPPPKTLLQKMASSVERWEFRVSGLGCSF